MKNPELLFYQITNESVRSRNDEGFS